MPRDIYQRLARFLDDLPGGFPATESGVELRILRRLFTPEEAELALHLTLIPEESRVVARRARISPDEAARRLEEMAHKGLIFNLKREGRPPRYLATQFAVGIWEFQVNALDPEFAQLTEEYMQALMDEAWTVPQLRTVPVGESISTELTVMGYEKAEELVRAQKKLLVAPCICRREQRVVGQGCDKPEETCLTFGYNADYYQRNGLGRVIDQEQAVGILRLAEEAGLVIQPGNAQQPMNLCCCCGCCCNVLKYIKLDPTPADRALAPFRAALNADTCEGCGTCVDRCQMEALRLDNGVASLNETRCIGCGLCVTTCPSESLSLVRKPESEQRGVPTDVVSSRLELAQARGKLSSLPS